MAEKQQDEKQEQRPRSAASLRREYERLAKACADMGAARVEHEKQVAAEVRKQMGDFDAKLETLKAQKLAAHAAWKASEARQPVAA